MELFPRLVSGRFVMKCMEIEHQCSWGIRSGSSRPGALVSRGLFRRQSSPSAMSFLIVFIIRGQYQSS
ncbi:TPA: hypothetical protein N0F65_003981 [Lagenidium giganteum]|uniref:Uncharacterized protein n=1 Tax=Lagenidium giganteum TaxID=4803 RepID=A0AAV2YV50_9STRA|nr:TPA: hypothetical protein N0F65_003981 [Lagenidium giganteum]